MTKTPISPAARAKMRAFSNAKPRDGSLEAAVDVRHRNSIIVMWNRMTLDQRAQWMAYGCDLCYPRPARRAA